MKGSVYIEYPKLKEATVQVLTFAQTYTDAGQKIDLRTCIEQDLGIAGLDLLLFYDDFETTFQIELLSYIDQPKIPLLAQIRHVFLGILRVLFFPITIFYFFFIKETVKQKTRRNARRNTLGDLVASVALGHYVKREKIHIRLKHGSARKQ